MARLTVQRWREIRLLAGLLFVALAVVIGWRVIDGLANRDLAWAARIKLPAGVPLAANDLIEVPVLLGLSSGSYWLGSKPPIGQLLAFELSAGQLLASNGLIDESIAPIRLVTVGVEPKHAPLSAKRGDVVDIYSFVEEDSMPILILSAVPVVDVADEPGGLGGLTSGRVSLLIKPEEVIDVVNANRIGRIDLVLHGYKGLAPVNSD